MANGMKAYVIRDASGDYMFMLQAILDSTIEAVRAAHNEELAQKLREEVESVRKLQQSVIPKRVDAPEGYEIIGRYEPSQIRVLGGQPVTMAGGDYYDVFRLPDDNVVLLVGDASEHGMKAAMSIMTMHTLVRMIRTHEYRDTAHFVEEINKQLCEQSIVSDRGRLHHNAVRHSGRREGRTAVDVGRSSAPDRAELRYGCGRTRGRC